MYFRAIDPYPLQSAEHNKLHVFYECLAGGRFVTTKCTDCERQSWPPRAFCDRCASDRFEWVDLPSEGTIHGFSIQETGVPVGFKAPLMFAVVKIADLRVFAPLIDAAIEAVAIGARVQVAPMKVAPEAGGAERYVVAFRLVKS